MNTNSSISLSPPYYKDYYARLEEFGLAHHHVQDNRCAIATTFLRKNNLFLILETSELEANVVIVMDVDYNNRTTTIPAFI
jgi:hypothetical protein